MLPVYRRHAALRDSLAGSTSAREDWDALLDAWAEVELAFARSLVERGMPYAEARHLTVRVDDQWCAAAHPATSSRRSVCSRAPSLPAAARQRSEERRETLQPLEHPRLDRLVFALALVRQRRVVRALVPDRCGPLQALREVEDPYAARRRALDTIRGEHESIEPLLRRARGQAPWSRHHRDGLPPERLAASLKVRRAERQALARTRHVLALAEQGELATERNRLLVLEAWAELKRAHARALAEAGLSDEEYAALASATYDRWLPQHRPDQPGGSGHWADTRAAPERPSRSSSTPRP